MAQTTPTLKAKTRLTRASVSEPKVTFIGLGDMGGAMAHNLIDKHWNLTLYARRPITLASFAERPVQIAATPREAASSCDLLCLCVVDAKQIDDILFGEQGIGQSMTPGSVVVVHSTIEPDACIDFAQRLEPFGIGFIDAPVTGAAERGRNGTLTIPVGGQQKVVDRCLPLLQAEGSNVIHLGGVGCGQVGKLLNNGLFVVQVSLIDEIMKLGAAMQLDPAMVLKVINTGTASSWASGFHARMAESGKKVFEAYETTYPGGVLAIVRKDIRLLRDQIASCGLGHARFSELAAGAVNSLEKPVVRK